MKNIFRCLVWQSDFSFLSPKHSRFLNYSAIILEIPHHCSSILNEAIRTLSSQFIVSYEKILSAGKRKSSQNQPTKQKPVNKKQQSQQLFARTKTSKRVEIVCFGFWCFLYAKNLFVKIINWLEIGLITSLTILLKQFKNSLTIFCWI